MTSFPLEESEVFTEDSHNEKKIMKSYSLAIEGEKFVTNDNKNFVFTSRLKESTDFLPDVLQRPRNDYLILIFYYFSKVDLA